MPPFMPMREPFLHRRLWSPGQLSGADLHAVFEIAATLKLRALDPDRPRPLRGRHVALLCPEGSAARTRLDTALTELGATVALLDTATWLQPSRGRLPESASLLGKLYDAIDCGDLPLVLMKQIEAHAGVPVFNALTRPEHPASLLVALLTMRGWGRQLQVPLQLQLAGDPRSALYGEASRLFLPAGLGIQPRASSAAGCAAPGPGDEPDFIFDATTPAACCRPELP